MQRLHIVGGAIPAPVVLSPGSGLARVDPWAGYYSAHAACPECGGLDLAVTCMGFSAPPDRNRARCSCGWSGLVHDLTPMAKGPDA
jgi:hypothetical protein